MQEQTAGRASKPALTAALAFILFAGPHAGRADNFQKVTYDPAADELIIVVVYRGTNPDHQFSLKWGPCIDRDGTGTRSPLNFWINNTKMPRERTIRKLCE